MFLQSLFGFLAFVFIAWLMSEDRRRVPWRIVVTGLVIQVALAAVLLNVGAVRGVFLGLNRLVAALEASTVAGASFVFGYLAGGAAPFEVVEPGASFILAFRGLPLILVVSALSSLLFYWKVLPYIVRGFSWALERSLRIGGAEGLGVSANIFVGMVEAPLLVRPYLSRMSRSELFSLMTCGMATIAGTVMVLYASILGDVIPNALGHILTASIISAPAAVTVAKILVPEQGALTAGDLDAVEPSRSSMDAITRGTFQGVTLLINVIAMLVVLVALVHLVNLLLALPGDVAGEPLTLQRLLGYVMAPVVWLTGIPWDETLKAGSLMGTKTILNEFIAYIDLASVGEGELSERTRLILLYAMCGFANPGSLGIMIGGMGAMAPERRDEIVSLGVRSIVAGTLATCMTGALVGVFVLQVR